MSDPTHSGLTFDQLILGSGLPRLEARILLAHASGRDRSWLIAHGDEPADETLIARFATLAARRLHGGEPVAYLIGQREFHGLTLSVSPAVLIPRPDTECLVDRAIELLEVAVQAGRRTPLVLDLGTGSGAIALSIAKACPQARIVASDLSMPALAQAQANAAALGLAQRIDWRNGSWWAAIRPDERFDLVVSNPPYIAETDPHLGQGDLPHEPIEALCSGEDGLDAIRTIAQAVRTHLEPSAPVLIEHGWQQGAPVVALLRDAGLLAVTTRQDLEGRDRFTEGYAPNRPR